MNIAHAATRKNGPYGPVCLVYIGETNISTHITLFNHDHLFGRTELPRE